MAAANTLAYYHAATIRSVKRFIVQAPGPGEIRKDQLTVSAASCQCYKTVFIVIMPLLA